MWCFAPLAWPSALLLMLDLVLYSFYLMWCFTPFAWLGVLLLLFDLLHSSFCLMWCYTLLVWPTIPLLLLDLMFHSICSTCYSMFDMVFCSSAYYSTPLAWLDVPLHLFDLLLHVRHGVLLLNLLFHSSCLTWCSTPFVRLVIPCSTWCSAPLVQLVALLFLFDLLFHSFCPTCCSTFLTWPIVLLLLFNLLLRSLCLTSSSGTFLLHSGFPCSFCWTLLFLSFLFNISISPLLLCRKRGVWKSCPNLNFSSQT